MQSSESFITHNIVVPQTSSGYALTLSVPINEYATNATLYLPTHMGSVAQVLAVDAAHQLYFTDEHLRTPLRVVVNKNPTVGQYGTVAAGLAAAVELGPTVTSPIIVEVEPGTYEEPALVVPSYVCLAGRQRECTIIKPSSALASNGTQITMSTTSSIIRLALNDHVGSQRTAIVASDTGLFSFINN